uniref:NADH-ubiquinone oxidoreductase chain 2 n=1 Tax=Ulomoides dermestoides TaxID=1552300 RepID=A0A0U1XEP8_9CUCU|nr:NADH dehydrogenase subunit 2 [Ulomoides dermestoides]AIS67598.1 NADH dehydrogenase subunit 2 [Ulomoides dermestoides]
MYKMIFFNSMILGTIITISSYSWLSMWMGLEINLLSIIPLLLEGKNMMSSESSMKYFITQALASLILLMSVLMLLLTEEFISPLMNFYFSMMLNSAIMTKLGAAPFHFWLPEVVEGLNWMNTLIILTWQKIAPMMILMNMKINTMFISFTILSSLIISTISGFNQTSLRKIMAFSSINHIAWMLSSLFISFTVWLIYFLVYTIININITLMFNQTMTFYINQINNFMNNSKLIKLSIMSNFLSLGGLPPFIGFLPKWMIINWMTSSNLIFMTLILIITTLIMLSIYMRVLMSTLILSTQEPKNLNIKINSKTFLIMNMISLMSIIFCSLIISNL